ncbi:hypothetical protein CNY89_13785 [Amaricoccus sp. HAR-UPW-R2A-40]|nr:hypothetical protein CNY89_13785 [Amaricoccus sp. HAR-UPW-R2A-40]
MEISFWTPARLLFRPLRVWRATMEEVLVRIEDIGSFLSGAGASTPPGWRIRGIADPRPSSDVCGVRAAFRPRRAGLSAAYGQFLVYLIFRNSGY